MAAVLDGNRGCFALVETRMKPEAVIDVPAGNSDAAQANVKATVLTTFANSFSINQPVH